MSYPAWFDVNYYSQQKISQMEAVDWPIPAGATPVERFEKAVAEYNLAHAGDAGFEPVTVMSNFEACNSSNYHAGVNMDDVNVSPNPLFDVAIYMTNLAAYYNQSGFAAEGFAAGAWTASTALDYLFRHERMSAWAHYRTAGMELGIDPSNDFDTSAYLAARAAAMGGDVPAAIAAIRAEGLNPLEDFFGFGAAHQIAATPVPNPVEPGFGAGGQWGHPVHLPDDKPVDPVNPGGGGGNGSGGGSGGNSGSGGSGSGGGSAIDPVFPVVPDEMDKDLPNYTDVKITGDAKIVGEDGVDTQFVAEGALSPDAVITGGANAENALAMTLGADWPGFAGVTENGVISPSVSNVSRVALTNAASGDLGFNAKNISDDATRFDVNNDNRGDVALSSLSAAVEIVNISNLKADTEASVAFADAKPQSLEIGLQNAGSGATAENAPAIKIDGPPSLAIASMGNGNTVSLDAPGLEKLAVAGAADIDLLNIDGGNIVSYDASAASGAVNFGVASFRDGARVRGGSGKGDTLTFQCSAEIDNADWSGVENIVFQDYTEVDASKAEGIDRIVMDGPGDVTVENLNMEDRELTVLVTENAESPARSCAKGRISGSIGDLTWTSAGLTSAGTELTADFITNATGDCVIKLQNKDRLGISSVFEMRELRGTITLEDLNPVGENGNGYNANTIEGVKFIAEQASGLNITHNGSLKICGSLWKVADVHADITNVSPLLYEPNMFKLPELPNLHNAEINAGGADVFLSRLGSQNLNADMSLDINRAHDIHLDKLTNHSGALAVDLDSSGEIEIKVIDSGGALDLIAKGVGVTGQQDNGGLAYYKGASANIDFSNIAGNVGSDDAFIDIETSSGALTYKGASGNDYMRVCGLGANTESFVSAGAGDDQIVVQTFDTIGLGKKAILNVDLGSGANLLSVLNPNQDGNLIVHVSADNWAASGVEFYSNGYVNDVAAANLLLAEVGAGFQLEAGTAIDRGVFEYGGDAYWLGLRNIGGRNITLVAAEGADADAFFELEQ